MSSFWVCLSINTSFQHGDKDAVSREIDRIFGDDLVELRIVSDDGLKCSGEYFAFVKCLDYHPHADDLKDSGAVFRVVPSYFEPAFLSDEEVDKFTKSVEEDDGDEPAELIYGDIVRVKEDIPDGIRYLSNLYGLVVERGKLEKWYKVYFRLETKSFHRTIRSTSVEYIGNVLESLCVRPLARRIKREILFKRTYGAKAREALENIVNRDKIYRRRRRKHEEPYGRRR
jgi:hypothetical protein